jgi:hypothetical protein
LCLQTYVTDIMTGKLTFQSHQPHSSTTSHFNDVRLEDSERLLVHMDCMNAFGQIVKIEDVDDMGGQVRATLSLSEEFLIITY